MDTPELRAGTTVYLGVNVEGALFSLGDGHYRQGEGEACGTAVPTYDIVSSGSIERGYLALCTRCFNAGVASALGVEHFEHVRVEPVAMTDCAGEQHEFHFRTRLLGDVIALEAFELRAGVPDGQTPLLVIDGRDVSWDQFGRMLMSFEGWQFRLAIRDRSEDA